jgi:PKHD-type hydroxylase
MISLCPALPNDPTLNEPFTQIESGLSHEEIERIRRYGDELDRQSVKLYGEHNEGHVKAHGSHFPLNDETRWLYGRMAELVKVINEECYQYDLTGFHENFYYLKYEAPGEHFNWHVDIGYQTPSPRKLSLVLQLSDPSEYEGGDFDVRLGDTHLRALKHFGIVTAFPAYMHHRVTPVTSGVRRTLAMFTTGPNFK